MNGERKVTAALDRAIGWTALVLLGLGGVTAAIVGLSNLLTRRHRQATYDVQPVARATGRR